MELLEPITQGAVTFEKGEQLAVAQYAHKYFVKLNTFGEMPNISDLIVVKYEEIKNKLVVVGQLTT